MLADLHQDGDEKDAGQFNLLSQLYSKGAGKALDLWVCRWIRWLVASNVASLILYYAFHSSLAATLVVLLTHLLLLVPWTLCLRASVVKSLLKVAGVWYYILLISTGTTMRILIYGETWWGVDRDAGVRAFTFCLLRAVKAVGIMDCLPLADASPSRTMPRPVRLFVFVFLSLYKSGLCALIMSLLCLICPFLYTALSHLYWYISTKIDTADIYSTYRVPELTVDGFVELSSLDYLIKSCMCLAVHACMTNDVCGALQT